MQILSTQEISQISGAFSTRNILNAAVDGITVGAIATGIAMVVCPVATPTVAVSWGLMQGGAALFGSVQFLSEVYDTYYPRSSSSSNAMFIS